MYYCDFLIKSYIHIIFLFRSLFTLTYFQQIFSIFFSQKSLFLSLVISTILSDWRYQSKMLVCPSTSKPSSQWRTSPSLLFGRFLRLLVWESFSPAALSSISLWSRNYLPLPGWSMTATFAPSENLTTSSSNNSLEMPWDCQQPAWQKSKIFNRGTVISRVLVLLWLGVLYLFWQRSMIWRCFFFWSTSWPKPF